MKKPIEVTPPPRVDLVVLLHGVGSSGADLAPYGEVWGAGLTSVRFVAPDAPYAFDGAAMGRQWFSIAGVDESNIPDRVEGGVSAFDAVVDGAIAAAGTTAAHTVLVGFSQGTIMALDAVMRGRRFAGVLGFSGLLARGVGHSLVATPVLLVHGDTDTVIPVAAAVKARHDLAECGVHADLALITGEGHGIGPAAASVGLGFLQRLVGDPIAA